MTRNIAVFATQLPAPSHTFIENEILALTDEGFGVSVVSLNPGIGGSGFLSQVYIIKKKLFRLDKVFFEFFSVLKEFRTIWEIFRIHFHIKKSWKFFTYLYGGMILSRYLKERRISHLHFHFANAALNISVIASVISKIKISVTLHGPSDFEGDDLYFLNNLKKFLAGARFISRNGINNFPEAHGFKNLVLIHCGINLEEFKFSPTIVTSKLKIVSVMRISSQKNPLMIPAVAELLIKKNIDFEWHVIGTGDLGSELSKKIEEKGLGSSVFLDGPLERSLVREKISQSNLSVLLSNQEGIPVFIMESMSLGRLVVATDVGGVGEILKNDRTGFLVSEVTPEAVANSISLAWSHILSEDDHYHSIRMEAFRSVERDFNLSVNVKKIKSWILSMG